MNNPKPAKLTAIGSGKGGTGKTFVAVTLAHALAHAGERVLLCDADFGLSNTIVHLGLESGGDMAAILSGMRGLTDCVAHMGGGTKTRGGFDVLAAPSGSGVLAGVGEAAIERLIATLKDTRAYDRIIVDLGAGVEAATLHLAAAADETIVVMTPDPAALTDAYAFTKLLQRAAPHMTPQVLVNMTIGESEGRRTAEALATTARAFLKMAPAFLGHVPRDARAVECLRRQSQLLSQYPQCPSARAVEKIAHALHSAFGVCAVQREILPAH